MRAWLLTSTYYGTWLPGDCRGSVTSVRDHRPEDPLSTVRFEHDLPGEPYEGPIPELERSPRELMKGPPIYLDAAQADLLLAQFQETALYRRWELLAVAIMFNHFHSVVRAPAPVEPEKLLGDFKAYGSRKLTAGFGRPASETWWTYGGSKRWLRDAEAERAAIHYVLHKQPHPLKVWDASRAT